MSHVAHDEMIIIITVLQTYPEINSINFTSDVTMKRLIRTHFITFRIRQRVYSVCHKFNVCNPNESRAFMANLNTDANPGEHVSQICMCCICCTFTCSMYVTATLNSEKKRLTHINSCILQIRVFVDLCNSQISPHIYSIYNYMENLYILCLFQICVHT